MPKYQIYCDRGNGLELDGCWGSENAEFGSLSSATEAAKELAAGYPDCAWVVCDADKTELSRIPATVTTNED